MLHRLLLLPLLSPLLAVVLVAAINPKPWVKLRLLTWTSPSWPLGAWMASAAGLGAAMSAAGAALALQDAGAELTPRRQVRRRADDEPEESGARSEPGEPWMPQPAPGWAGPSRSATDPAPTVSVPFRVIRKGQRASDNAAAAPASRSTTAAAGQPASSAADDDWGSPVSDDW